MKTSYPFFKSFAFCVVLTISATFAYGRDLPKIETVSSRTIYVMSSRIHQNDKNMVIEGNISSKPGQGIPSNPHLHITAYDSAGKLLSSSCAKINPIPLQMNRKMPLNYSPYSASVSSNASMIKLKVHVNHLCHNS